MGGVHSTIWTTGASSNDTLTTPGAPAGQSLTSLVPGCDPVENDHTLHTYTHNSHIPLDSRKVLDGECGKHFSWSLVCNHPLV